MLEPSLTCKKATTFLPASKFTWMLIWNRVLRLHAANISSVLECHARPSPSHQEHIQVPPVQGKHAPFQAAGLCSLRTDFSPEVLRSFLKSPCELCEHTWTHTEVRTHGSVLTLQISITDLSLLLSLSLLLYLLLYNPKRTLEEVGPDLFTLPLSPAPYI